MSGTDPGELFENWRIQMRKGGFDFCILKALAGGECCGYALVKTLLAIPGIGVAEGSIYPLLSRLKKQGLVDTRLEESSSMHLLVAGVASLMKGRRSPQRHE